MELLKAILLGAVQGVTEFLPISSTGHLILFEKILGVSQEKYGLTFDAALHLGTLFAILWFFKNEWLKFFTSILRIIKVRRIVTKEDKLVGLLVIGTIPAVLIGLLLEDTIDTLFRSPTLVAVSLILFSGVLHCVEKIGKKQKEIGSLNKFDGLFIGTAQAIALTPGVSRSGITIAAGMWRGLKREQSARFAFLLSAPIVAGAGGKKIIDAFQLFVGGGLTTFEVLFFATGMISAAVFGYLTIKYFLKYISSHSLYPFIVYRVVLGLVILGMTFI